MKRTPLVSVAFLSAVAAAACGAPFSAGESSSPGSAASDLSASKTTADAAAPGAPTALTAPAAPTALRVRLLAGTSGATTYKDSAGNTWTSDEDFDNGTTDSNTDSVAGTADPTLFQSERYANRATLPDGFTYTFNDIDAGQYQVTLAFAETSNGPVRAAGEREFNVYIDGTEELTNFDIYAEAGGLDKAVTRTFTVEASTSLTVRFVPGAIQNPKVNALSIVPLFTVAPSVPMTPVASTFFGLHTNNELGNLPHGTQRIWDAGSAWAVLQTSATALDFSPLQARVTEANKLGIDLMYTFGRTPHVFATISGAACSYDSGASTTGECDPPDDLTATKPDQHVKDFWNGFMSAMCTGTAPNKTCGPIKYFEMWNEPNGDGFWSGTAAQLAQISADSTEIIKNNCSSCVVVTSNVSCGGDGWHQNGETGQCDLWMDKYLTAWQALGHLPDAAAWHPYSAHTNVDPVPFPETNVSTWDTCAAGDDSASCTCKSGFVPNKECRYSVTDQIGIMRGIFDAHGLAGKPMFATEGAWGDPAAQPDADQQAAYLTRWYTTLAAGGVARAYWYHKDLDFGRLVENDGTVTKAGVAYKQLYSWLVGASIGVCVTSGTVWSCPVTEASGKAALILWDTSESCANGTCTTHGESVASSFTRVRELDGSTVTISGNEASIGAKPIIVD